MGAWGVAILSDDTALDVKGTYTDLLEDGHAGAEATSLLLGKLSAIVDDPDEGPVLWLALAATQWKLGRLGDEVKAKALDVIDNGRGLALWEEAGPTPLRKRKAALEKLREQLNTPQPPEKKIRKPWRYVTDLQVGDAISYRLDSGQCVILRVVRTDESRYGIWPVFELCDWVGHIVPSAKEISRLPYIVEEGDLSDTDRRVISPHKKGAYPVDKIQVVARGLPARQANAPTSFATWVFADKWLNHIADRLNTRQSRLLTPRYRMLKKIRK